jgi:hypothetical protein
MSGVGKTPAYIGVPTASVTEAAGFPGYDTVDLEWEDPTEIDFVETIVRGVEGTTPPASVTDGFEVYHGRGEYALAEGLHPGASYAFSIFAKDAEGLIAAPATLSFHGVTVTMHSNKTRIPWGGDLVLSGKATDAATGAPIELGHIGVVAVAPTGEVSPVVDVYTNSDGTYDYATAPEGNFDFYAVYITDGSRMGAVSTQARVYVTAQIVVETAKKQVPLGQVIKLIARAGPIDPNTPIVIEQYVKGTWRLVTKKRPNADGVVVFKLKTTKKGKFKYRAYRPVAAGADSGTSKPVAVTVT